MQPVDMEKPRKLTGDEARMFTYNLIQTWRPKSQVWPFEHGDEILSGMGALSAWAMVFRLRKELKLRHFARMTCYVPTVGMTALCVFAGQSGPVTSRVLELNSCCLCIMATSAMLQLVMGICYPLIMTPIVGFRTADKLLTYPIPSITKAPKESFLMWKKMVMKYPRHLCGMALTQMLLAAYITYEKHSFVWTNLITP